MNGFQEKAEARAERGYWMGASGIMAVVDMETEHIINCLNIIDASKMPKVAKMFEAELSRRAQTPEEDLLAYIRELEEENAKLSRELANRNVGRVFEVKSISDVGYEIAPATRIADYMASYGMRGTDRLSESDGYDWSEIVTSGWHPVWGHS